MPWKAKWEAHCLLSWCDRVRGGFAGGGRRVTYMSLKLESDSHGFLMIQFSGCRTVNLNLDSIHYYLALDTEPSMRSMSYFDITRPHK